MARKRSKKKTDFNQYLPLLLIGALVVAFVFLGAGPTGKFVNPQNQEMPPEEPTERQEPAGGKGTSAGIPCLNPLPEDQDCDNWLRENDCDDSDSSLGPWRVIYTDNDGDGYGIGSGQEVCTEIYDFLPPTGYTLTTGDCDDTNSLIWGSLDREYLNSPDYNCDGKLTSPVGTIFVHGTTYTGNLGGISGANTKCTSEASAGSLTTSGANWIALLSDSNNAIKDSLPDVSYRDILGNLLANDKSDLLDGSIIIGIDRKTDGSNVGSSRVWTGSKYDGSNTRQQWTSDQWICADGSTYTNTTSNTFNTTTGNYTNTTSSIECTDGSLPTYQAAQYTTTSISNCNNWTSTTNFGAFGQSSRASGYLGEQGDSGYACSQSIRLYCVRTS